VAQGFTLWFTGLSGAGKTTLSSLVAAELNKRKISVEVLDGDEVREHLSKGLTFTREDRDTNVDRIAFVASLLTKHGVAVVTAAISPYRDARESARRMIGNFVEIYVRCSVDELVRRDVKGLYARALRGEIERFTGISDTYEEPLNPDILVDSEHESVQESLSKIMTELENRGLIAQTTASR
jgi:adenylylsulfate kinase